MFQLKTIKTLLIATRAFLTLSFFKSRSEYYDLTRDWVMGKGTAVLERSRLYESMKDLGRWHRSKDKKTLPYSPFTSYMINKKWWLEEQFNVHMLRFQQVKCIWYFNNLKSLILCKDSK